MATHRISINWGLPDSPNDEVFEEPIAVYLSNDRYDILVTTFNDPTGREGRAFWFKVPKNYVSGADFKVSYITNQATANVFRAEIDYRAIGDGESLDPSTDQENLVQSITVPATTAQLDEGVSVGAATDGNFAVDDLVVGTFYRDHNAGTDTVVGKVGVVVLEFEYADV